MATKRDDVVKLMVDGEMQEALVRTDGNGEWACKTLSGRIFYFAKTDADGEEITLIEQIERHNAANSVKPIFADEVDDLTDHEWENWGKTTDDEETPEQPEEG